MSGNWTDPAIWMSNHGKRSTYPGQNGRAEDIYIGGGHTVTTNAGTNFLFNCNNLYIAGTLSGGSGANRTLYIYGDVIASGAGFIDAVNPISNFWLFGVNNSLPNNTITGLPFNTTNYGRNGNQPILPIPHISITLSTGGIKFLTGNITTSGNVSFTTGATSFEMGNYDVDIGGNVQCGNGSYITKSGSGSILIRGLFTTPLLGYLGFIGNPTVELRGGISFSGSSTINTGTGVWSFTTNNQTLTSVQAYTIAAPFSIASGITLTNLAGSIFQIDNTLNGVSGTSTFINKGTLNINTAAGSIMTTGTYDYTSFANTVVYMWAGGNVALPAVANYNNLSIAGAVIKTASVNITTSGNLLIDNNAIFSPLDYNLTIGGTTRLGFNGAGTFTSSTTTGVYIFIGQFFNYVGTVTISGTPNMEFRGGINANSFIDFGNSVVGFTINNQSIIGTNARFYGQISIIGAITVTLSSGIIYVASVQGTVAGSTLTNNTTLYVTSNIMPLASLGVFNYMNTGVSILGFYYAGNMTLPYTTFAGLSFGGSGTKTALGNTTVNYNLLSSAGTFDLSTFNLTVNGTTTATSTGNIAISGNGNVLFIGLAASVSGGLFQFTGAPLIECRGGFSVSGVTQNLGAAAFTFTTNNQNFTTSAGIIVTIQNILVSGAITLTAAVSNSLIITGTLNGNNVLSTFDNRGATTQYQNAAAPMITGVLQTNAAANTFIYNKAGAQDVAPGTYRTLTLAGSGVKTLQGNVVVATLYTLTAPATLALNGFTRT